MNNINRFLRAATFLVMMLALLSGSAMAQKGGGGGGGGNGGGTDLPTPLVFDYVATVNGKTPTWSGDFTLTAPTPIFSSLVTELSFSVRAKNLNLPDNTRLYVNLNTSDKITGASSDTSLVNYHCMASPMQVVGKLGIVKAYHDFVDDLSSLIVRRLDTITITDAAGNVLATAHPQP